MFGKNKDYLDISSIHVLGDMRAKGIGKELFRLSINGQRSMAYRNYIFSARFSLESQAFYQAMGRVEFAGDCEITNKESAAFYIKCRFQEANRIICFTKAIKPA